MGKNDLNLLLKQYALLSVQALFPINRFASPAFEQTTARVVSISLVKVADANCLNHIL